MADQPPNDLTVPKVDAGAAFRLEMWAANLFLGYWWVAVAAAVVVLVGAAIYGFYLSNYTSAQRVASAEIATVYAEVERDVIDLPGLQALGDQRQITVAVQPMVQDRRATLPPVQIIPFEAALRDFPKKDVDAKARLARAGDELMAIHARSSQPAAANAALLAAEMYRLAESPDGRKKALDAARSSGIDTMVYPADAADAAALADAGDLDGAAAVLRPWITAEKGYFGQRAAFDLGWMYAAAGRTADATATWSELRTTWPTSPLLDEVDAKLEKMGVPLSDPPAPVDPAGSGAVAPGPEGAPGPTPGTGG